MIRTIYLLILGYFLAGGIGFYFISRKKNATEKKKIKLKFSTYFIIIHLLFFSIVFNQLIFRYLSILIIFAGFYEFFKLYFECKYKQIGLFVLSVAIYGVLALFFFLFGGLEQERLLFSFLIVSIFDSFSQVTGQLWGGRKLFPSISPRKTIGGLVGGTVVALLSSVLIRNLVDDSLSYTLLLSSGIIVFAFLGDMATSFYKRQFNAKDFSNLIPGHGGFLDRFDSLIAGGAWVTLYGMF